MELKFCSELSMGRSIVICYFICLGWWSNIASSLQIDKNHIQKLSGKGACMWVPPTHSEDFCAYLFQYLQYPQGEKS